MNTRLTYEAKYQKFLELPITHGYFRDGEAQYIKLAPTQETIRLLKNLGLVLHITPLNKIMIAYNATRKDKYTVFQDLVKCQKITFRLENKNAYFFNYTQVLDYNDGTVLHFSFLMKEKPSDKGFTYPTFAVPEAKIKTINPVFNIPIQEKNTSIIVKDMIENEIIDQLAQPPFFEVNLSKYSQGAYTLLRDGEVIDTFYTNKLMKTPTAFIDIYFGDVQFPCSSIKAPICIHFIARRTIWQYVIIDTTQKKKPEKIIINVHKKKFEYVGDIQVTDNQIGWVFNPPKVSIGLMTDDYLQLPIKEVQKKEDVPQLIEIEPIPLPVADKNQLYTIPIKTLNGEVSLCKNQGKSTDQYYSRIYYYL